MIRVAVVEDDPASAGLLQRYLRQYEEEHGEKCAVACFGDGDEIADGYQPRYDIILMDIDMRFLDGMTAAEEIRKLDGDVIIIFITNLPQYAIRGYAVDALDYVLKPVSYYAFSQCLNRALSRLHNRRRQRTLWVSVKNGVQKLNVSHIKFIEVDGRRLLYHTTDGIIDAAGSLGRMEAELQDAPFFRCNKGYLINLEHVTAVNGDMALVGGETVPLSRAKRGPFLDALNNYLSEVAK